ncbi:Spt20 family-domain-containing protein [Lentinula aciculospora]|uniref:Spt20 family-domain-containing protein n=1 Tax=Lentinula aciculospora TaxID=153920 RepID=A0A9W8ZYE4_9AGAR|nr:Spt20 family-domain-containing protein [Lentinula aciculospora]
MAATSSQSGQLNVMRTLLIIVPMSLTLTKTIDLLPFAEDLLPYMYYSPPHPGCDSLEAGMERDHGLLERYKPELPSFTIHLHPDAWTLNSGSRCRYDNQYVGFLDDVRAHRIPADFVEIFHESGVRYFEGCLIVDLLDYRPSKPADPPLEIPEKTREVLHPTPETLWADLCVINANSGGTLTDLQALEIEARILLATSAPLCLDPDPHLSRIANDVLRITTPSTPVSLKRKASALDAEKVEAEKARKEKIIGFLAPDSPRVSRQFRQLELRQRIREEQRNPASVTSQALQSTQPRAPSHTPVPPLLPAPAFVSSNQSSHQCSPAPASATSQFIQSHSPTNTEATRRTQYSINRVNGANTPVNGNSQPHHSPSPQPHVTVYPNPQAAAAMDLSAKRTPTPAQRFSQSPRISHMQPYPAIPQNHHPHGPIAQQGTPHGQSQPLPPAARASPRPPSTHPQQLPPPSHPQTTHSVQPAQQQLQPQPPQQPIQQSFQTSIPGPNFLQPPPSRNVQAKASNGVATNVAPAQNQVFNTLYPPHANHASQLQRSAAQMMMIQQQQRISLAAAAHQAQAQSQAQSPHNQPNAGLSAVQPMQQSVIPGASPMMSNARIATRSPMPPSLTTSNGIHNQPNSNPNQNQNSGGGSSSPNISHISPATAAVGATNSPRPRSRATGTTAAGVNSPRVMTQTQQRPVQSAKTPKQPQQQPQQFHPNIQQQRRATPSQSVPNVVHPLQQQQQQQQPQQHGTAQYPMYAAYGVPAQAAGYSAGQLTPQYFAAMGMHVPQGVQGMQGMKGVQAMKGMQGVQMTPQQIRALQQQIVQQQQQQYAMAQARQAQQQAQHKQPGR